MEIAFSQDIYYSNTKKIPIAELANSLLSLERISVLTPILLERLFDDVTVVDMSIYVDDLEGGSLKETVKYYLWVAFQNNISDQSGVDYKNLADESETNKSNIVGWLLAASIIVALKFAADKAFPNAEKPHIQNQMNITIQAGRDITGLDEEKLLETIKSAVAENSDAVKGAVGFSNPAKKEKEAYLSVGQDVILSPEVLQEIPSGLLEEEEQERVVEFEGTDIYIRATDKDSGKTGWGATIPEFSSKRIRMHIAPGIDLSFLAHMDIVVGNIAIFYTVDNEGRIRKPHVHLFSVDKERSVVRNDQL
jgi:hypothetical protein